MVILLFLIALIASIAGSISGVGGGVIIKPVLDATGLMTVSAISFYSGSTVLSMTIVNLIKSFKGDTKVDWKRSGFLAAGSVLGGLLGNKIFNVVSDLFNQDNIVGLIQSLILFAITLGVLIFTINKSKLAFKNIQSSFVCIVIGLLLGMISSFLGIGGGPINIAAISYLLGMSSKVTALNSLFVVFCSQASSIGSTIINGEIPQIEPFILIFMIIGGVGGGLIGSKLSKKFNDKQVDKFFTALLIVLCIINIYNIVKFTLLL